jgi:hypothetical protein
MFGRLSRATMLSLSRQFLPGQVGQRAGQVAEGEIAVVIAAEYQFLWPLPFAQEDGHGHDSVRLEQLG